MRIGVLHPGEMGASVAGTLVDSGHEVAWVGAGRSAQTTARAAGLLRFDALQDLAGGVDAIISVCPPAAALAQARGVAACDFAGLYVDANAVAPQTAMEVARLFGAAYVDGGIIGPPALEPGTTRLYLAGERAAEAAAWFAAGALEAIALDAAAPAASALKMAYAAYTKGSSALLLAVNALAQAAGVHRELQGEWALSQPDLPKRSARAARGTSPKAWRFVGEMQEIERTFAAFGLPGDFHAGAAEIYRRMAAFKDAPPAELEDVIDRIVASRDDSG